jgi:hypothetical protein
MPLFNRLWRMSAHFLVIIFALATIIMYQRQQCPDTPFNRARLHVMLDGTGLRPYVYRILVPALARDILTFVPSAMKEDAAQFAESNPQVKQRFDSFIWDTRYALEYYIVNAILLACLIGFAYVMRALAAVTVPCPAEVLRWVPLAALAGLPPFFSAQMTYDMPLLLLFAACLYLLRKGKYGLFLLLFPLAVLNKETAILLAILFAWYAWRKIPRGRYVRMLFGLAGLYIVIKGGISYLFRHNPGSFVHFHLFDYNIGALTRGYGFRDLVAFGVLFFLTVCDFRNKDELLQKGLIAFSVVMAGMGVTVFMVDDYRAYFELYPIVFCLILGTLLWLWNRVACVPTSGVGEDNTALS